MNDPTIIYWNDMKLVKVSDAGEKFSKWLYGQTMPMVERDESPFGWAYYDDYKRYIRNLPIID